MCASDRLTSKPVLSRGSNLRKRSANIRGALRGPIFGTSPHSRNFFPSGSERSGLECHTISHCKQGQYSHGLVSTRSPDHVLERLGFRRSVST